MNAIIYLRKSTDEEDRQVLSLKSQKTICEIIAKKHGLTVVGSYSESISAKEAGKRQLFAAMIDSIKKRKAEAIIVWKPNRLARNGTEGGIIVDLLNANKVSIFCESGEFKRRDSTMLYFEFVMSTKYSQDLSDDVKTGMDSKVERGWRPGKAPLGYKNSGDVKGEKTVVVDPITAPYIKQMFDLALAGKTVVEILEIVTRGGLRVPATRYKPSRTLGKSQPYRILKNPFYFGDYKWKGKMRKGIHEPLITREQFDRTQQIIFGRSKNYKIKHDYWWLGLLRCQNCGCAITAESKNRKHTDGTSEWHHYARCTKKRGKCNAGYMSVDDLESQLQKFMVQTNIAPKVVERFRKELVERNKREFEMADVKRKEVRRIQDRLFENKRELVRMETLGMITEEKLQEEKNKILAEEALIEIEDIPLSSWIKDAEIAANFAGRIQKLFDSGDGEIKRDLFRILGSDMRVKDKIVWCTVKPTFEEMQNWEDEDEDSHACSLGQLNVPELGTTDRISSFRSGWGELDSSVSLASSPLTATRQDRYELASVRSNSVAPLTKNQTTRVWLFVSGWGELDPLHWLGKPR